MAYNIKPLACDPTRIKGMSEKLLVSHYENNYGGAVNRLNAITAQLAELDFAKAPGFVINGLKREELIASNSMILHELFFASLGDESAPEGELREALTRDFGSLDRWQAEFSAMGKAQGGGSGWVLLTWSPRDGKLINQWAMDHTTTLAGGIPILFQTARLHGKSDRDKVAAYGIVCRGYETVLGFELGRMFAPNGEIFSEATVRGLMDIPELKGLKHSSLDRLTELGRLALRDAERPGFRIYTGNDLGINMIEYGSDYLLGLATFAPEKFAERDRLWETGDPAYYALGDALQYLGNVAFREPVPAYKHSAATFLHLLGRISTDRGHAKNPTRPAWEPEILRDCARRLGYEV